MARLVKKGSIKEVGTIRFKETGRGQKVFCTQHVKPELIEHEVYLTMWLMQQEYSGCKRHSHVDQELRPDAELYIAEIDSILMVEMDMGTENLTQVRERMEVYRDQHHVMWVCRSEERKNNLQRQCPYPNQLFDVWKKA